MINRLRVKTFKLENLQRFSPAIYTEFQLDRVCGRYCQKVNHIKRYVIQCEIQYEHRRKYFVMQCDAVQCSAVQCIVVYWLASESTLLTYRSSCRTDRKEVEVYRSRNLDLLILPAIPYPVSQSDNSSNFLFLYFWGSPSDVQKRNLTKCPKTLQHISKLDCIGIT